MSLKDEFQYYLAHQTELVKEFDGKFLVIHGQQVVGSYDSQVEAIEGGKKRGLELGTFLVQRCSPGSADITQTFHSRVSFA